MASLASQTRPGHWDQDSPVRQLLRLSLPIIAMMVSRMLMGFIDFWMVKYLGTVAQAAISPAVMLVFTVACLGMGVANSVQTFVSQADGRDEPQSCGPYAWQSLYIAVIAGLATWPLADECRRKLGYAPGPYSSALHLAWRMRHDSAVIDAARAGRLRLGLSAAWLLTAMGDPSGHQMDYSLVQAMACTTFGHKVTGMNGWTS